jgi:uncharacterized membrane protein
MYCPECGTDAADANFCPECGNDLMPLAAETRNCPECGTDAGEANFCPECGQGMGTVRAPQRRNGRPASSEGRSRGRKLHAIAAVAAIAAIVVVTLVVIMGPGEESAVAETVAVGGKVEIPLQDLASGEARFYTYDVSGVPVRYFVMKSPDGQYRAAFDASKECGPFNKGFRQEGTDMVCNKCGEKFASVGINVLTGECNPSPIKRNVVGEALVLKTADLERGAKFFR